MALRYCRRCKAVFNYLAGDPLCPRCKKIEEEDYQKVRTFLRKNPRSTLEETVEETGVSSAQIMNFIRQERIMLTDTSGFGIECERCGVSILTGRYCDHCKHELEKEFSKGYEQPKRALGPMSHKNEKMHYLNKDNINKKF